MCDIRSWSPSSSGSLRTGASVVPEVVPVSVMPPGSRIGGGASHRVASNSYALGMPERTLILASGSPARLRLLRQAGFDPKVVVSGVPEDDVEADDTPTLVRVLAERKATAVADIGTSGTVGGDGIVLGCDSMLE